MSKPVVSVIIPTYNRSSCIHEAIDSVLLQKCNNIEIVVVDDGSTDETEEVLKKYRNTITYIKQRNQGVSVARNTGIKNSNAELIAFLDSDDTWVSGKLEIQLDDMDKYPNSVAHIVDTLIHTSVGDPISLFELRNVKETYQNYPFRKRPLYDVLTTNFFPSSWMIKRKAIESAGIFNPSFNISEDTELLSRIALEGPFIVNCFQGTNLRRVEGSAPLSDLFKKDKHQYYQNSLLIFRNLLNDSRVLKDEKNFIQRAIGGIHCDIFRYLFGLREYKEALKSLISSIKENPGFRSIIRATLTLLEENSIFGKLYLRKKKEFRRSVHDSK